MFDTTLDLFCHNENLDDKQHTIDMMRDTYWDAMNECANSGRNWDAISVYEEWVVDGQDPEDGQREFTFIEDLTREEEEN